MAHQHSRRYSIKGRARVDEESCRICDEEIYYSPRYLAIPQMNSVLEILRHLRITNEGLSWGVAPLSGGEYKSAR